MTQSRRLLFIAVILLVVATFTLLGAELILRLRESMYVSNLAAQEADSALVPSETPSLYYRLKPGYTNAGHVFNSQGFNMGEKPLQKPAGVIRIVFFGDSATQGTGTDETSQAYPNQVDRMFKQRAAGEPNVEAWNCGVAGYNVEQVLAMLREVVPALQPDVCVYYLNFNDCWPPSVYENGQAVIRSSESPGRKSLLDYVKSLRVVSLASDLYRSGHHAWKGYAPSFVDGKTDYPSWKRMKSSILEMRDYCRDQRVAFLVGVHPREQFLHRPPEDNLALQDVLHFLRAEQIRHLDLRAALVGFREEEIYLPDGDHCTPRGYTIIANAFVDWFKQLSWSDLADH